MDIATGWTEQRAVWGKNYQDVIDQIKDIERSLPFPILGFDSDNGSEFLNHHLLRYLTETESGRFSLPAAAHTKRTITRISNRKTGPMYDNGSVTIAWTLPQSCRS